VTAETVSGLRYELAVKASDAVLNEVFKLDLVEWRQAVFRLVEQIQCAAFDFVNKERERAFTV